MQLKALIATLVIGSSSVAFAGPMVREHRTPTAYPAPAQPAPERPVVKHHLDGRLDAWYNVRNMQTRPRPLTWVTLASDTQINGRAFINVPRSQRQFTKLTLRADGKGKTQIDKVLILFGNGTRQIVDLDAKLSKRNPALSIDLTGNSRNIERIVLVGRSNGRNASVDVLAI